MRSKAAARPGVNKVVQLDCAAVAPGPGRCAGSRIELPYRQTAPREAFASHMSLNADARLLPEHTGTYLQHGPPGTSTTTPQLGAAINRGYGRAPTSFVYTSADTVLGTTAYQSPAAAARSPRHAATATATAVGSPSQRVQAYAFVTGGGGGGSASGPASPLSRRTLLYTRGPAEAAPTLAPAVDLLDRMTLLRRMAPTAEPAPRPYQLTSAAQQFTPAPPPRRCEAAAAQLPQAASSGSAACRRWAWDDSLLGSSAASAARPIGATPAPGWRYCGDVVASGPAAGLSGVAGTAAVAAAASTSTSWDGHRLDLNLSVATGGGCDGRTVAGAGQGGEDKDEVVVVVRSPRPHHLHWEEEEAAAAAALEAAEAAAVYARRNGSGGTGRAAFRPPGPLQHKFGNKPQLRPRSAPSAAERARAAGLRGCGCPRSPRHPAASSYSWQGRAARSSPRRQVAWEDEADTEVAAFVARRPCSAAVTQVPLADLRRSSPAAAAAATAAAAAVAARPRSAGPAEERALLGSCGRSCGTDKHAGGGTTTTTTVTVTAPSDADVVVISSPRAAASLGLGCEDEGQDVLVVASSPRLGGASGGGSSQDVLVVHHHEAPAARASSPAPRRPAATAAAAVAAVESPRRSNDGSRRTKMTVTVPAPGSSGSFRVKAGATAAATAAPAAGASGASSPIKAWRRPAQPDPPATRVHAPAAQQQVEAAAGAPAQVQRDSQRGRGAGDDLARLECEMQRREKSFHRLLAELDRISAKCATLTAGPAAGASGGGSGSDGCGAGHAPSGVRRPYSAALAFAGASPACTQRQQHHTTHCFGGSGSAAASRAAAETEDRAAASPSGSSRCGRSSSAAGPSTAPKGPAQCSGGQESDWGWESLLAFEQHIREQQRKLVEQGVLPPEYR